MDSWVTNPNPGYDEIFAWLQLKFDLNMDLQLQYKILAYMIQVC